MIDTEALRKKVIDLAIQGKLTEQLSSDGDAETLYSQIQEEKAKLIKIGKIRKERMLQQITEKAIPYSIPNSWKWVRLESIGYFISGYTPSADELYSEGNIPYFKVSDMNLEKNKIYMTYTSLYLRGNSNTKQFDKNTIVYPKNGGALLTNKKRILGQNSVVDLNTGGFMPVGGTNVNYVYLLFLNIDFQQYHKGSAVPTLDMIGIKNIMVPLPPILEQKRIVDAVNCAFESIDIIDELQQQYEFDREILKGKIIDAGIRGMLTEQLPEDSNVEDVLKSIRSEKEAILVKRKGRPDKNIKGIGGDVPFEIPNHWRWVRLGDIGLFKKGPFGSSLTKTMFVPKGDDTIKVYEQQNAIQKNSNLGTYYITKKYFETKMIGFEVCSGDIIVSCAGTIGESYIMPDDIEPGIINQALMRITLPSSINKRFFQYYFDANLKKNAQEESNGSAIKNIPPFDVLKNWYFPVSSYEEQERISNRINELISLIN